jgi:hypothetical protein
MALTSKITLTLNSVPAIGTAFSITASGISVPIFETFQEKRLLKNQVALEDIDFFLLPLADRIIDAIQKDSNTLGYFTITKVRDTPINQPSIEIKSTSSIVEFSVDLNTTAGALTITAENIIIEPLLGITNVAIFPAEIGNIDTTVKIQVTTTELADNITSPIQELVTTNPFDFEFSRVDNILISVTNSETWFATKTISVPQLLSVYFDLETIITPSGSTFIVNKLQPLKFASLVKIEYSIGDDEWGTSNSWSGLEAGSYTLLIRDNLGSQISIPFEIETFTDVNFVDYDPIIEISNANALRFKENVAWDTNGISKNVNNTLSHEENTILNRRDFIQRYQKNDTVRTQIKSNYDSITAKLIECGEDVTAGIDLTIVQATDNMDIRDVRDGKIKTLSSGIGVYFGSGKTYDPETLLENGTYNLLEYLMDWINVGDYINIDGLGWGKIDSLVPPTKTFQFHYITVNIDNTLNYVDGQSVIITSAYNLADFNRFEFSLDLSSLNGNYYVLVDCEDAKAENKQFISEWINVQDIQEKHHEIKYYSTRNNEINYGTGIIFTVRLEYMINLQWKPNSEQEIYVTDTRTINLDSKVREFYKLNLMPLPTAMAQKVVLILAHNRLFIDGVSYLLEGEVESSPVGVTNTYKISANLVKTDYVFDSKQLGLTSTEILLGSGIPLALDSSARGLLFIE